jgi:hypothetical protein
MRSMRAMGSSMVVFTTDAGALLAAMGAVPAAVAVEVSRRTGVNTCGRGPAQATPPRSVRTRRRFTVVPVGETKTTDEERRMGERAVADDSAPPPAALG